MELPLATIVVAQFGSEKYVLSTKQMRDDHWGLMWPHDADTFATIAPFTGNYKQFYIVISYCREWEFHVPPTVPCNNFFSPVSPGDVFVKNFNKN